MKLFCIGRYPSFMGDDCFQEVILANETPYTDEEFKRHVIEAKNQVGERMGFLEEYLKRYKYYQPDITTFDLDEDEIV